MDRDMQIYIKNDANVTEEFIQTMEAQDEAQERLNKIRKQTRMWRGFSVFWLLVLIVILLYSVVTVIKKDDKQKTYFVDIERSMPKVTLNSLEPYTLDVNYYCKEKGTANGTTTYDVGIEADDYRIASFHVTSENMSDSFVTFQKWLTKRGVALDNPTSTTETLYETSALASLLVSREVDYSVNSIAKSEKKFKCSPAVYGRCSDEIQGDYANLINTYFNEDFVKIFSKIHNYEVAKEENEYFYLSFYNKDIDIDAVCDIVLQILSDNVGYFDKIDQENATIRWKRSNHAVEGNIAYRLQEALGTGTRYNHIDYEFRSLLQDLDPEVKTSYDEDAPVIIKFCISGEHYELYAYIMRMYGLLK